MMPSLSCGLLFPSTENIHLLTTLNANVSILCLYPQMTSLRRWALNQVRPLLRGQAPPPASTDPDWALTQQVQPSICPSWAPLCQDLCPAVPLCSPHVRDHTPWTSLKCVPAWSPHWLAESRWVISLAITSVPVWFLGLLLICGVGSVDIWTDVLFLSPLWSLFQLFGTGRVNRNVESNDCHLRWREAYRGSLF